MSAAIRSRIFPPFQLPFFTVRGTKVGILECDIAAGRGEVGTVISADPLTVATKLGAVCINRVQMGDHELCGRDIARMFELRLGAALQS